MADRSKTNDPRTLPVELGGISLRLFGGGGVYYPQADALLVADLHLGKGASFRKHAIPVPRGSTRGTLNRVSDLLNGSGASRLFILGDLFHDPRSISEGVIEAFSDLHAMHPNVATVLVRGNHDRGIDRVASRLPIDIVDEGHSLVDVCLHHHPPETVAAPLSLAGHVHPSTRLRSASEDLGRQPCFWLRGRCLVLPAIGEFTGTYSVRPSVDQRVWVDLGEQVMEIPASHPRGRGHLGRRATHFPQG